MSQSTTVRMYVRVARNRHGRTAFKVDAKPTLDQRPLTLANGQEIHTVFFALDVKVPLELLDPKRSVPHVAVELDPEQVAELVVVEQADVPHPQPQEGTP